MHSLIVLLAVVGAALAVRVPRPDAEHHWAEFRRTHQKQYHGSEELQRRFIFEDNLYIIQEFNRVNASEAGFRLGINQFADMTNEEFRKTFLGHRYSANHVSHADSTFEATGIQNLPAKVDWTTKGYVTPVKNQGQCGSCWAFSTTGSLEGQHFKKTGKLVSLSEQNLIDCSDAQGNNGCNGGLMDLAFDYIKANGGIDTEQSYPYSAVDGICEFKKRAIGAKVTGYVDIKNGDESALKEAVATVGPVSIAIDASSPHFQLYSSGVYTASDCSSVELDHGVLAVGYGHEDGKDYWLVKNSWGTSWGIDGYIKMIRNKDNRCGIATQASYPTV
ncbi:cathepsin L-like [Tropilaelaps mercedesae]|uniref:Cathepsin L-like n=1 Tax=Tropilaelaps mercedesae TaxID=418985 RepID=A0A1V9XGW7_9ACAR|nr:cathepsin L-like [Tropilaelaps mercedesae]